MKYKLLMAACVGLIATNTYGQAPAGKECRTLAAAGNFIGADEVLEDGMVCKISKAKLTTPAATATADVAAEASGKPKLLGATETKTTTEEKSEPTPPSTGISPSTKPQSDGSAAAGSVADAQGTSTEADHPPSLGDVARAYRKIAKDRVARNPVGHTVYKASAEPASSPANVISPAVAGASSSPANAGQKAEILTKAPAATPATTLEAKPEIKIEATPPAAVDDVPVTPVAPVNVKAADKQPSAKSVVAAQEPIPEIKVEAAPAAAARDVPATPVAPTNVKAPETQPVAKSVVATQEPTPEIKIESAPAAATPILAPAPSASASASSSEAQPAVKSTVPEVESKPEIKPEIKIDATPAAAAPVLPTTTASAEPQAELKTGTFDATATAEPAVRDEVRPALPLMDSDSSSERPQEIKLGVFEAPKESEAKPTPVLDPFDSPLEEASTQGPRPGCTRLVSLGSMEKDRLVLATPVWAVKWLERNQKKYPGICFSDTPLPNASNYLIVFFTAGTTAQAAEPVTNKPAAVKTSAGPENGTFTTNFGSTWHYTYENAATTTVTTDWTDKVPHNLQAQTLYATAYTEQGIPISQHWPEPLKDAEKKPQEGHGRKHDPLAAATRVMSDLLDQMLADIPLQ